MRLVVFALTMACVIRVQLGNSYAVLLSDSLDGLIQDSVMQHWSNVFQGLERWNGTAYFYPNGDTLGYNDGFFLNGAVYSVFRAFCIDPFLSAELAGQVIRAIGFFTFELFAAAVLGFPAGWALLGAAVFTLSNNLYIQAAHAQLLTVSFAPLLGWLLWRALMALRVPPPAGRFNGPATLWGCAAALLYGAWLMSGFYMAWFATFFLVLVVLATAIQDAAGWGAGWRAWRVLLSWPAGLAGGVTLLAILPFLLVYLPKAEETGAHSFDAVMVYDPAPMDILHIGSGNVLFGALDRAVTRMRPGADDYGELTIGFPPLLAVLATAGAALACTRRRGRHPLLLRVLALATAVSLVVLVHFGDFTPWYWVHAHFPGAKAVRVVARYAIFLAFPVTVLAVDFLRSRAGRWPAWIMAVLVVVLVAEEVQSVGFSRLDRADELQRLAAFPPPPPSCRGFFVQTPADRPSSGSAAIDVLYLSNVDAMMLAEMLALPTVNGFSTFNPPSWNFTAVGNADYLARVRAYLDMWDLHDGLCGLDMVHHAWITAPVLPMPALEPGAVVALGQAGVDAGQYLGPGWDGPDKTGRWGEGRWAAGKEARLSFAVDRHVPGTALVLEIDATAYSRHGSAPSPIAVEVDGAKLTTWRPAAGAQILRVTIPPGVIGADNQIRVHLSVVPPITWLFAPPRSAMRLGLFARSFRVLPGQPASVAGSP